MTNYDVKSIDLNTIQRLNRIFFECDSDSDSDSDNDNDDNNCNTNNNVVIWTTAFAWESNVD